MHIALSNPQQGQHAIPKALERAQSNVRGATAFLSLAPWSEREATLTLRALLESKIARVVIAMRPSKAGFGFSERLQRAGVEVVTLGESATSDPAASQQVQCAALAANEDLLHRRVLRLPLGLFKYAMTLDGKIAAAGGHSLWVSGSVSRARVMRERAGSDAVIVGGGTVRRDDPRLTARVERGSAHQPARIVCSPSLDLPQASGGWHKLRQLKATVLFCLLTIQPRYGRCIL